MNFITKDSPLQLIAADYVFEGFKAEFGDKYVYNFADSDHISLETLVADNKNLFYLLIEEEATETFTKVSFMNHVVLSGLIIAPVRSSDIQNAIPHLTAIEWIKRAFIGRTVLYKEHQINGQTTLREVPSFATWHDFTNEYGGIVLRAFFDLVLDIEDRFR